MTPTFVLVTGMSGAGRSMALKIFEDLGYEAVDNMPLPLLAALIKAHVVGDRPVAVGIDSRTRGFSVDPLIDLVGELRHGDGPTMSLLFLDCDDDVLMRRFKETRRRHPLAVDRPVTDAIQVERQMLGPLRAACDHVIDTSLTLPADLRRLLAGHFQRQAQAALTITLVSFSFRVGLPREADLVFDVRFLRNPYYDHGLRSLDGRNADVGAYIAEDEDFDAFFASLTRLVGPLLPRYQAEGKSYLTIAFGCTGGRHRSVYLTELFNHWLTDLGHHPSVLHRDVARGIAEHTEVTRGGLAPGERRGRPLAPADGPDGEKEHA